MHRQISIALLRATSNLRYTRINPYLDRLTRSRIYVIDRRLCTSTSDKHKRLAINISGDNSDRKSRQDEDIPPPPQVISIFNSLQEQGKRAYSRLINTPEARLMRLDKPIGTSLLFLPCAWSITLASTPAQFLFNIPLFYTGSLLLRGAGCTINDIWDVDLDKEVSRTRSRPLASGEVSMEKAWVMLGTQLFAGLGILTQLNTTSFLVGTVAVLPVIFYPFAKRQTAYPQLILATTFNTGALLGYTAITDSLGVEPFLLYGAGMCWTMVYDTIYAFQDKRDDERVGVFSTARTFGSWTRPILATFVACKWGLLMTLGNMAGLSNHFAIGSTIACARLLRDVYTTDFRDPQSCHDSFIGNSITGAIVWGSILLGRI